MRKYTHLLRSKVCSLGLFFTAITAHAQGPLAPPPGAPAPTMKTLEQIEPRTDLFKAPLAAVTTSDPDYHYVITQPGSYYVSGNLVVTKTNGIRVDVTGVTLDLNGFQIRRGSGSGGDAVTVSFTGQRCTIKDGTIGPFGSGDFAYGVRSASLLQTHAKGGSLVAIAVSGCTTAGLAAGDGWKLDGCTAQGNAGDGIVTNKGCLLASCVSYDNAGTGISAGTGSALTHCTSYQNSAGSGIAAGTGSTLSDCTAYDNSLDGITVGTGCTLTNLSSYSNGHDGIVMGNGGTLTNSSAQSNTRFGITARVLNAGVEGAVTNCVANSNGNIGIFATVVTGCTANFNEDTGISGRAVSHSTAESNSGVGIVGTATTNCSATSNGDVGIFGTNITECIATSNVSHGIHVSGVALNNQCRLNGTGAAGGAGIYVSTNRVRVEGNTCFNNDWGIRSHQTNNCFIVRNTCADNLTAPASGGATGDYDFSNSNIYGPIVTPSGGTLASGAESHAWANFRLTFPF